MTAATHSEFSIKSNFCLKDIPTSPGLCFDEEKVHNNTQNLNLEQLSCFRKPVVKNLGVLFDSSLKFDKQINLIVKSSFYHLRLLAKALALLQRFWKSNPCLYLYPSWLLHLSTVCRNKQTISRLQMVQNPVARVYKNVNITPILTYLHWLPVTIELTKSVNCY